MNVLCHCYLDQVLLNVYCRDLLSESEWHCLAHDLNQSLADPDSIFCRFDNLTRRLFFKFCFFQTSFFTLLYFFPLSVSLFLDLAASISREEGIESTNTPVRVEELSLYSEPYQGMILITGALR